MTALPWVAEAGITAVLVVSMRRAFFGPAPPRADPVAAGAWLVTALIFLATVALTTGDGAWRLAMSVAGVEAACAAGWWIRSRPPREDGEPESGEGGPGPDWDAFDRLRDGWSRGKAGSLS